MNGATVERTAVVFYPWQQTGYIRGKADDQDLLLTVAEAPAFDLEGPATIQLTRGKPMEVALRVRWFGEDQDLSAIRIEPGRLPTGVKLDHFEVKPGAETISVWITGEPDGPQRGGTFSLIGSLRRGGRDYRRNTPDISSCWPAKGGTRCGRGAEISDAEDCLVRAADFRWRSVRRRTRGRHKAHSLSRACLAAGVEGGTSFVGDGELCRRRAARRHPPDHVSRFARGNGCGESVGIVRRFARKARIEAFFDRKTTVTEITVSALSTNRPSVSCATLLHYSRKKDAPDLTAMVQSAASRFQAFGGRPDLDYEAVAKAADGRRVD
jgi:hypothetical protein